MMPISSTTTIVQEEDQNKNAVMISFTNGAKQQIEELKTYFNVPNEAEVVKLGISLLANLKKKEEEKAQE